MKKISVVVPAYNAAEYLAKTLYSIHVQTVKPFEVVIVNDCSTDDTEMIARACGKLYFHNLEFTYLKHKENMGIGATRQDGALAAKGEFVAFLSSDDVYDPSFLLSSIPYLDEQHATFTDYWRCNSKLEPIEVFNAPFFNSFEEFRILAINWALMKNMFVNFSSVIIPKHFFQKITFIKSLRHGEDLIFLLDSLIEGFHWNHIRKPLLKYRIHNLQGTVLLDPQEAWQTWKLTTDRLLKCGVPKEQLTVQKKKLFKSETAFKRAVRMCLRKGKAFFFH